MFVYDAYGTLIASDATAQTTYLYCGEQFDGDLGFYYLRAYLNPNTGRFWTMDSYEGEQEDPPSLHKFGYCKANPANGTDASGRFSVIEEGAVAADGAIVDTGGAVAVAVARAFAMRRLEIAVARWTLSTVVQLAAAGATVAGYEVMSHYATSREMERVKTETANRSNPTGSPNAYEKYKCDLFEVDAEVFFRNRGKSPRRITYDSFPGKTWGSYGGNICAIPGFGLFGIDGGQNIAVNGHHEGTLVEGRVYDNNVPFGVPRKMWENGYEVGPRDKPLGVFFTLRQAHNKKYGVIAP